MEPDNMPTATEGKKVGMVIIDPMRTEMEGKHSFVFLTETQAIPLMVPEASAPRLYDQILSGRIDTISCDQAEFDQTGIATLSQIFDNHSETWKDSPEPSAMEKIVSGADKLAGQGRAFVESLFSSTRKLAVESKIEIDMD